METLREIRSNSMIFSLRTDQIIAIKPIPGVKLKGTLENAMRDIECLKLISEGKLYPNLCWLPDVVVTKEARDYYSSLPPLSMGTALIVRSPIQRILGNFFLGINKVNVATKLFTDEPSACTWLREISRTHKQTEPVS